MHDLTKIPELDPAVVEGAKLYANRCEMIKRLGCPKRGVIAEVGVAAGDFSDFLIQNLDPERFIAVDLFQMDRNPVIWGIPQEVLFKGMGQLDYYRHRFQSTGDRITILHGNSHQVMQGLPDASIDLIYVDAGHEYENVSMDIQVCERKIKPSGTIVFNDYVLYEDYGVVQGVNEMLAKGGWKVVGFALQRHMFCDIAVRRI
jgi:hypothetical protein